MPEIRVAVVGAGIAGLTAALRLAERGYTVTVYEENPYIGGQFGAHTHGDGIYHEHCYHMFMNWYHNFWQLAEDIGLQRERDFMPHAAIKYLRKDGTMTSLANLASPTDAWANLLSGTAPVPDMYLYLYSFFDLLGETFDSQRLLDEVSVSGFLRSRPYMTEQAAFLHQENWVKAFAMPSYLTAATTYQHFVSYVVRDPAPIMWVLKGNSYEAFWRFLVARFTALGGTIRTEHRVTTVQIDRAAERARAVQGVRVTWPCPDRRVCYEPPVVTSETFCDPTDYVILAVQPHPLSEIITNSFPGRPALALETVRKLRSEPIASLDLYFKRTLPNIPKEHVILLGSAYDVTFIDNAQAWPGIEHTALNVAASNFDALAGLPHKQEAEAFILQDLRSYVPFADLDIDWDKSHIQTNTIEPLFVNEVGSWQWRPHPVTDIPNVLLAGDFCRSFVDVVTLEGAVVTGLQAVQALLAQVRADTQAAPIADSFLRPVEIHQPDTYPVWSMQLLRLLLAPSAYAAKWWSTLSTYTQAPQSPMALSNTATQMMWAPATYAAQWWQTAWSIYTALWSTPRQR